MRILFPIALLIFVALGCGSSPSNTKPNSNTATFKTLTPEPTPEPTPAPTYQELKNKANALIAEYKTGKSTTLPGAYTDVAALLMTASKKPNETKEAEKLQSQLNTIAADIKRDTELLGPKPENSSFDGSVQPVKEFLRKSLNDYDSSEFVEWSPVSDYSDSTGKYWVVRLKLRAKNAFGAYVLRDTYYFIRGGAVVKTKGLGAD